MCNYRCLPRGLVTLQEWLTEDVPSDWWVPDGVYYHFFLINDVNTWLNQYEEEHTIQGSLFYVPLTLTPVFVSFANFITKSRLLLCLVQLVKYLITSLRILGFEREDSSGLQQIFLNVLTKGTKSSVFYRPAQLTAKHSFVFLEHVQLDNLQTVPPVQQPADMLVYTPAPQIKVGGQTLLDDMIFLFLYYIKYCES